MALFYKKLPSRVVSHVFSVHSSVCSIIYYFMTEHTSPWALKSGDIRITVHGMKNVSVTNQEMTHMDDDDNNYKCDITITRV